MWAYVIRLKNRVRAVLFEGAAGSVNATLRDGEREHDFGIHYAG